MSDGSPELVVGVAGHIDHGKTALVRVLTGIDTDRLPEEKARGITIELGFAHLQLPSGRVAAVVDMPGHEKFVRAMIAGAGGVDLVLLVVAANEGVMPQTREHLAIATLLGCRRGVVALTKTDLASDEIRELAIEEVKETLAGSALEGAAIVPVSAFAKTGLDALVHAIDAVAPSAVAREGPTVLPIDRVFVRKGFGTVVTGTLVSGHVAVDDALVVAPIGVDGEPRDVRVRGLQVHGRPVESTRAPTRLAVNLAGLEASDIPRGAWLYRSGEVALTRSFDAKVTALPGLRRPLSRRSRLELAVGAAHEPVSVSLLEGDELAPGATALARLATSNPVVLRPGEHFVLRGPPSLAAIGTTVGGGVVVRPSAERVRKRDVALRRARDVASHEGEPAERARIEVEAVGSRGLTSSELYARTGHRVDSTSATSIGLAAIGADRFVARTVLDASAQRILQALSAYHGEHPADRGMERRALRFGGDEAFADAVIASLVAARKLEREGERVWRAGWKPKDPDAIAHLNDVHLALRGAGVLAPRPDEIAQRLKTDAARLEPALKRLVERGDVVRVNAELYVDASAMADLERRLVAWLEAKGTIDAQGFKELSGASRKWSIPLSEFFDAKKVTLRVGDIRKLRGR